jgi:hypothetical protein
MIISFYIFLLKLVLWLKQYDPTIFARSGLGGMSKFIKLNCKKAPQRKACSSSISWSTNTCTRLPRPKFWGHSGELILVPEDRGTTDRTVERVLHWWPRRHGCGAGAPVWQGPHGGRKRKATKIHTVKIFVDFVGVRLRQPAQTTSQLQLLQWLLVNITASVGDNIVEIVNGVIRVDDSPPVVWLFLWRFFPPTRTTRNQPLLLCWRSTHHQRPQTTLHTFKTLLNWCRLNHLAVNTS